MLLGPETQPATYGPALIDDHTPTPRHARFSRARLMRVLAAGLSLWVLAMAALIATQGLNGSLTLMAWFFTKAALLTFGGAYAVLPYVYQGAVENRQWLSGAQMIDGLALGETTPGPLIMVVAYVGFVGGWPTAVLGPDALFWGGALAATVVTFSPFCRRSSSSWPAARWWKPPTASWVLPPRSPPSPPPSSA